MVRLMIGVASALMAVASAGYEPAPDFEIPQGATLLPPSKYCLDNPPIPYTPFTPEGGILSDPIPDPNGCEPAMVFCGLNPNVTQRVEWCSSCVGLPPGMGWSNNIDYAMTTNCALGARYSDCDLDNEEGIDIGSVAVSVENQSFTVSLNEGYEITGYDIQVGSGLNTVASANFAGYQTRGGSLADGASVNSAVGFQGSDWFVMHAMVCPADRVRSSVDPQGAGGIGGSTVAPTRAPTIAPTPAPTFNRTAVGNLWGGERCDPHMALKSCPAEKFKMYFSRTISKSGWASTTTQMAETQGMCINKPGPTRVPAGFTGSITTTKGGNFLTKTWRNQTDRSQSWVFKWSHRHCYVIEAATRTVNGNCLLTNQNNVSELCEEFQFNSPTVNINRTELIFGCCDMTGDGNVTVDVGDLRYADEGTQDNGNKTTKFGGEERVACETYQDYDLPNCTGPFCQGTQTCSLRRGLQQIRFDSWPDVPVDEREEVFIQVMIIDTGEIYNFTHNTTGFPGKILNGTVPDNFFIRPSFYIENRAWFNAFYNAQYRDGIALQFYSTTRGPGGWNACVFSPIGIDITRSNAVQMIEGNFSINIDGNELTSTGNEAGDEYLNFWFGPQVGILVHNPPNSENVTTAEGEITGHHLLGDMGGQYADGYAKLATFDTNQDGEVAGAELEKFHLWVDANSNAHMDAGELKSLGQYSIVALYTMHDCRKSRARLADGTEILTEDLWFSRRRRRLR